MQTYDNLTRITESIKAARFELSAADFIQGKTDEEVRIEIHKMQKQFKRTGEREALAFSDALLEALNDRRHARARVAAVSTYTEPAEYSTAQQASLDAEDRAEQDAS